MGIQGLIQFLEKASSPVSLEDIRGHTVAIDSYCWLHKGAFGCADQLSRGEDTDKYIKYCLKYVNLLLSYDIKPILVFDGRHLPAKALTEKRRRESREQSRKRAAELLRLGQIEQARSHMKRCIDITHEMAHRLMQECRKRNVDYVVAPYEADSQLAYLNKLDIAQYVITEDSDLILFGCSKVIFKLDLVGKGLLVDSEKLYLAMGYPQDRYTFDKFQKMCILSGCDYLDSLPGIGLVKACKFFCRTEEADVRKALLKVPSYLNLKNVTVTEEYIENFLKAYATFQYMFVFDPFKRKMVRLNELPENFDISLCSNAGESCDKETAMQLALGNLNPFTMKKLDNWNPDKDLMHDPGVQSLSWSNRGKAKHKSIWQPNYKIHKPGNVQIVEETSRCAFEFKRYAFKDIDIGNLDNAETQQSESEIMSIYSTNDEPINKRQCREIEASPPPSAMQFLSPSKSRNPFFKAHAPVTSPILDKATSSLLKSLSPRKCLDRQYPPKLSQFKRTACKSDRKVISRYFKANTSALHRTNTASESSCKKQSSDVTPDRHSDVTSRINNFEIAQKYQHDEATVLYLSSPEATLPDRGDRTPPREDCTNETTRMASVHAIDSGIEISSNEKEEGGEEEKRNEKIKKLTEGLFSKFEFRVTSQGFEAVEEESTIVITDDDPSTCFSKSTTSHSEVVKKKPKPIVRRVGLSKTRTKKGKKSVDATQSKLSKFFYKKT